MASRPANLTTTRARRYNSFDEMFDHIGHPELVGSGVPCLGEPGRGALLVHKDCGVRPQHPAHVWGTRSGAWGEIR
jgi:hypothetical protein